MNARDIWRYIIVVIALAAGGLILSLAYCDRAHAFTLVHVQTKAGTIVVNQDYAWKFRAFIDALPYTPRRVVCFAAHGHVKHSLHHIGAACDVDQRGRNRTSFTMYHVTALAAAFGLRDGCSFHDCGHVDIGLSYFGRGITRVASIHHHHHHRYLS